MKIYLSPTFILFISLYLSFCECDKAETVQIPESFSKKDIYRVFELAKKRYIDPERINQNLSYVKASQAALRSLPYSLLLYSKEYLAKRKELAYGEPVVPGKVIEIDPKDPFVIFVPDYNTWDKTKKAREKEIKKRNKSLNDKQRRELFVKERKKQEKRQKFRNSTWDKSKFSSDDFSRVLAWVKKNWEKYKKVPKAHKSKINSENRKHFGLHETYFYATNGFLRSMDPHTSLVPRTSWKKMLSKSEDASFEGIGALLRGGGENDVIIETPLPGSPALQAGLRAGDIIRKVDGKDIEGMLLSDVVKIIRGERDTVVILHVERPSELKNIDISIKRNVIKQLAVTNKLVNDKTVDPKITKGLQIGVIQIKSFLYARQKTSALVVDAYQKLLKKSKLKLDVIVVDLRGNPGGYLEEGVAVADLFLPPKKLVVTVKGKGNIRTLSTRKTALIKDIPIVTLINSASASASEILASALMDHNTSLVLGERSFGKATVQTVEASVANTVMKITSARYYAPKGYTVQVYGVLPDIKLSNEADNSFPPRFREEDMWDHLPHLKKYKISSKRKAWIQKLQAKIKKNSELVKKYIKEHKSDALRLDYMLIRAIPYIHALKAHPKP